MSLCTLFIACILWTDDVSQQKDTEGNNPQHITVRDPNEPTLSSMSREEILRSFNEGVPTSLLRDVEDIRRKALGIMTLWSLDRFATELKLGKSELVKANELFAERRALQEKRFAAYRASLLLLKEAGEVNEKNTEKMVRELASSESAAEDQFLEKFQEILDPSQQDGLANLLAKGNRFRIGDTPFLSRNFKLTVAQKKKFQLANDSLRQFLYPDPSKSDKKIKKSVLEKHCMAAENCLDDEQFKRFFIAVNGLDSDTLADHYKSVDATEQDRLCKVYRMFRAVRADLGE